ncbi:Peptidase-S15 domain-containing protein [Mycena sanguinolenta]|uniref:Peptidase-S15 domain-containing protein n=1 Tax=Mycena sanguinolenta TaxID=230812 RepID=A0A8H6ZEW2_9AGAR|nr:Peptidase-S15 domain-containing protein [Mycena sanguinolenta]
MTSLVPLSTGVSLEVKSSPPPNDSDVRKLAVCLHPWSWLGGRWNDPVLHMLMNPLHARGYHVLRYNSRGVGRSTGWPSFTGLSEASDLAALIQWAVDQLGDVRSVVVLGYSYGSLIASLQPILPNIPTSHILISYPVGVRGWLTMFKSRYAEALKELLSEPASNVLVVVGDSDEFTSAKTYRTWKNTLETPSAVKLKWVEVESGSHFWRDSDGDELVELVSEWVP